MTTSARSVRRREEFRYQARGRAFLVARSRAVLADQMGLGKSRQAIDALDEIGARTILIITPASVRPHWMREFPTWSRTPRRIQIVTTTTGTIAADAEVVICSYTIATAPAVLRQLMVRRWCVLILDEAQNLKESSSARTKAIYGWPIGTGGLISQAGRVWLLSGTLAPNHVGELWTHARALGLTELTEAGWTHRYTVTRETQWGAVPVANRRENLAELRALLRPVYLRRRADDVLPDFPRLWTATVPVEADAGPLLAAEADPALAPLREALESGDETTILTALQHAAGDAVARLRRLTGMAKLPGALALLRDELEGDVTHKVAIFAHHKAVVRGLAEGLAAFGAVVIEGKTRPTDRQPPPDPVPDPTTFDAVAPALWANGYLPLPLTPGDKNPVRTNWQCPLEITSEIVHAYRSCGCGILTAISPAADVDVRDPAAAADLRILAREMLGDTITRVGQPPKFAALYRTDQPFPKVVGRWLTMPADDPEAEGYQPHRVEVLANGQQLVTHAIHPGTGRPYAWSQSPLAVTLADLPAIDHHAARAFVDAAEALMIEHHGAAPVRMRRREWTPDDRPRGQRSLRNPEHWWWLHAIPFNYLVDYLDLRTEGEHIVNGRLRRWSQTSLAMRCPNHRGNHGNSLNFSQAADGTVLFHCYGGCDPEDVAEQISEIIEAEFAADLAGLARTLEARP